MSAEATETEISKVLPRAELQTWMKEARVPGVSISVIKNFKIHWSRAFGVADATTNSLLIPETPFQAASTSKPVMAVAAAVLADRGQLDLDADVQQSLHS